MPRSITNLSLLYMVLWNIKLNYIIKPHEVRVVVLSSQRWLPHALSSTQLEPGKCIYSSFWMRFYFLFTIILKAYPFGCQGYGRYFLSASAPCMDNKFYLLTPESHWAVAQIFLNSVENFRKKDNFVNLCLAGFHFVFDLQGFLLYAPGDIFYVSLAFWLF